jgi:hypothetical protein
VNLRGASGKRVYWVLLLVYVVPWATHFTGYCCWSMCLGNTLLGIAVGFCETSGNTPYWVLFSPSCSKNAGELFITFLGFYRAPWREFTDAMGRWGPLNQKACIVVGYVAPLATHFTGYCRGLCEVLGNTLYWASIGLMWKRISPHKQNHMALLSCFPINLYKHATIRQISYSQTCTFPLHEYRASCR